MKQSIVNKLGNLRMKEEKRSRNGHIANMGGHGFGLGTRKSGDEELRDRWQRPGEDFIGAGLRMFLPLSGAELSSSRDGWMDGYMHACVHLSWRGRKRNRS